MATIQLTLNQSSATSVQSQIGIHQINVDRPEAKGGGNKGPMGGQYLLAGIGGCFCSTLFAAAISRKIEIMGLQVLVSAEMTEDLPTRFGKISLEANYEQCSHPEEFPKLLAIAEKGCLAVNTIKHGMAFKVEQKLAYTKE